MQTLAQIKRRIDTAGDLHSVVRTMKSLAAVNISQYEKAAESLEDYAATVEMALQVVLQRHGGTGLYTKKAGRKKAGAVVFGSDQGMCGSLNEQVASHALDTLGAYGQINDTLPVICSGLRASGFLFNGGLKPDPILTLPGSVTSITTHVGDILSTVNTWHTTGRIDHVLVFHARQHSKTGYTPHTVALMPLDEQWLQEKGRQEWDSSCLPMFTMSADQLFSRLVSEYLFITVFRACAESLASENAARLAAMQGAQTNIEEMREDLEHQYNQRRQMAITDELLDIVSGFEALSASR